jgi:hypothetical protein
MHIPSHPGPLPPFLSLQPPGADSGSHSAEAIFTFNKLQFGQPSQMRPRWLVFAATLLGGGCVYSHYQVPTVVMSRLAEQFDKVCAALELLAGDGIAEACLRKIVDAYACILPLHVPTDPMQLPVLQPTAARCCCLSATTLPCPALFLPAGQARAVGRRGPRLRQQRHEDGLQAAAQVHQEVSCTAKVGKRPGG